jgi:UDPglucose 6-dehydrogenase
MHPTLASSMGADTTDVEATVRSLSPHLERPAVVAGKSTVPVGTAARMAHLLADLAPAGGDAEPVWNPEFVREGSPSRTRSSPTGSC